MSVRAKRLVVVGQGYVGLPLSVRAVEAGYDVVGVDVDSTKCSALNRGVSYIDDVCDAQLGAALRTGRFEAKADFDNLGDFDYAVITVPTPLRETLPDLRFIESATRSIAPHVSLGSTVVLESTTSPGTTAELVVPLLESGSGLTAGRDFHVGYSPERIDPGNRHWSFETTPKVVSGIDAASLASVTALYDDLVETTVPVSGTREAELAKLIENTFRHVNIALVNELAIAAHELGIDAWEAIEAAGSKPFGFMKFTPGPGVGGHCLPVDPSYLSWEVRRKLGRGFRFIDLANEINAHMPEHVVTRVESLLNDSAIAVRGARVLIVGLAYKADTGDVRESPALRVAEILRSKGAVVVAADPHVTARDWPLGVEQVDLTRETAASADVCVVLTPHAALDLDALRGALVLDTRNVVSHDHVVTL
ncbi:UDP-N-acetyl-D-glucosamine dehydrogenase [Frondihabitans sp. PAMC 28766]|uniref:nucleotide sugar dehydrogenase n=1 Tax=Frondihabitans sp. PAMC 28766 TaxID=1795630 RepID=UPI00078EC18A|nr:nucleotide sugar dehydrogenase [Frondihabitans sp. PAMC 28766]AMM19177.1 UDP-N-acetyl-D-glucosamine dehydrogenase [Frondihabitans sp. PAMC 28766]